MYFSLQSNDNATVAIINWGLGGPWPLPGFWLAPCLAPPVFCLIARSSWFDWHIQQVTFSQQNFKGFVRLSGDRITNIRNYIDKILRKFCNFFFIKRFILLLEPLLIVLLKLAIFKKKSGGAGSPRNKSGGPRPMRLRHVWSLTPVTLSLDHWH